MTQRPRATATPTRTARPSVRAARDDRRRARRPDLERQSISFTVGLYLFICVALLLAHVTAGGAR
ncbi:hypothetical protein [Cellulosimicrobium composti]|uniref:hypothetical protein n=1 Tax=Cellulosimicrobium composti TaxID=2672572 RepID=UPI000E24B34A